MPGPLLPTSFNRLQRVWALRNVSMEMKKQESERNPYIAEVRARQRNTVWPDTLRNSRGLNELLFRGVPDAPLVQRLGVWILGLFVLFGGLCVLDIAYEKRSWQVMVFSSVFILIGVRVFLNGFRGRKSKKSGTE